MDFILLSVIFFVAFSVIKNEDYYNRQLSIQTTSNLQVIAVMFVMMHHLSQVLKIYPDSFLSSRLIIVGRFAVGIFFFVSGYGLIKQYKRKGDSYLKSFFNKKILNIGIPFLLAIIIYFSYRNLTSSISINEVLVSLINGSPIVTNGWFAIMIFYLYIVFFISAVLAKNNDLLLLLFILIGTGAFILLARNLGYGEWWTNATLCYPLGIIWSMNEKEITKILFEHFRISVIIIAIIFSLLFYIDEVLYTPLNRMFCVLFFVSLVILISYKVTFENKLFDKIKVISFEMYLYQGLFINLFRSNFIFIGNRLIYTFFVIVTTMFFALITHFIIKNFRDLIRIFFQNKF